MFGGGLGWTIDVDGGMAAYTKTAVLIHLLLPSFLIMTLIRIYAVLLSTLLRIGDWRLALLEYPSLLDDPAVRGLFDLHVRIAYIHTYHRALCPACVLRW